MVTDCILHNVFKLQTVFSGNIILFFQEESIPTNVLLKVLRQARHVALSNGIGSDWESTKAAICLDTQPGLYRARLPSFSLSHLYNRQSDMYATITEIADPRAYLRAHNHWMSHARRFEAAVSLHSSQLYNSLQSTFVALY